MLDRRDFLRTSAAATAAALAGPRLARAADGLVVAIVRDKTKSVIKGSDVDAAIAQKLVDQAVMAVAGKDELRLGHLLSAMPNCQGRNGLPIDSVDDPVLAEEYLPRI